MEIDYPASHSQDTCWFAVDDAGHVGVFYTGSEGHMPVAVADVVDQVLELCGHSGLPADESRESEESASMSGLYYFEYDEDYRGFNTPVAPYRLNAAPVLPLHVDQLPPALREQVKLVRVAGIDFAACEFVQPVEQVECRFWRDEELAYLAGDGKTVRPIPGKEDRFAEFCRSFRKEHPEQAKDMIFEQTKEGKEDTQNN